MAPPPKSNRTFRIVLWGAALAVVLLALYAIRVLSRERLSVVAAQVTYQDLVMASHTNGKVEPMNDFEPHAPAAGQVQEIYVNVGDKVKAGDLLLKMDDADALAKLASANSALRAAELAVSDIEHGGTQDERNTYAADEERAKLQRDQDATALAALQQLQQKGAASPAEINAATTRLHSDEDSLHSIERHSTQRYGEADRARAEAELADARAGVAAAQRAYASVDIHTPISGTVYYLPVSEYDYVASGDDLVYVGNLKQMRITAYFDEPEIGNLATGQPVTITWEAKPGVTWHGHIIQVPTTIINYQVTRNVGECLIDVDDADGELQPNANVLVTVTTAHHPHVLSIPRTALPPDGSNYVYRIVNNKLVRTPIQTGIINLTQVEITGGLSEGDTVALSATTNQELSNGLEVTPIYK